MDDSHSNAAVTEDREVEEVGHTEHRDSGQIQVLQNLGMEAYVHCITAGLVTSSFAPLIKERKPEKLMHSLDGQPMQYHNNRKRTADGHTDDEHAPPANKRTPSPESLLYAGFMGNGGPQFSTPAAEYQQAHLDMYQHFFGHYSPIDGTNEMAIAKDESSTDSGVGTSRCSESDENNSLNSEGKELSMSQSHLDDPSTSKDIFCQVTGRLSLMGNGGKYDVTVAEVRRRLANPECLNSSILAAILRKAKTANNGQGMRRELEAAGISLPVGRRKQGVTTALSALVEGEASHLATDLDKVTLAHYPFTALSDHFRRKWSHLPSSELDEKKRDLVGAVRVLSEFGNILFNVQCPLTDSNPPPHADTNLQMAMNHYSLVTHGFGVLNQRTWVKNLRTLADQVYTSLPASHMPSIPNQFIPNGYAGLPGTYHPQMGMDPQMMQQMGMHMQ